MNTNLLREDERDIYDSPLGLSLKDVDLLISRLCEARAEKYEFAAQQLEQAAIIAGGWTGDINTEKNASVVSEVCRQIRKEILKEAAELRRLANG